MQLVVGQKGCALLQYMYFIDVGMAVHWNVLHLGLVPDDPRGVVGESLQMWCSISSTSGVKSSDLELCFQLVTSTELPIPVNSRFIQIVNETTVEMNYLDLNMSFNNAMVFCGLSCSRVDQKKTTETKLYDLQLLRVGCKYTQIELNSSSLFCIYYNFKKEGLK